MHKIVFIVSVAFIFCLYAKAQDAKKGESICNEVQNSVNGLVDYTKTRCLPSAGSAGAFSFILVSSESVFSNEPAKKGWLLVVVACLGKALNDRPSVKADELLVSDANLMKSRVVYVLRAELAKLLQRQISNNIIDLERMYATIQKNLVKRVIQRN